MNLLCINDRYLFQAASVGMAGETFFFFFFFDSIDVHLRVCNPM
jgi:hypothetical protein